MQGDDRLADAAAYVLGALEPDEVARAEAALATDPAFRRAVDEAREALDLLPYATPAWTPPQHLRQAVLSAAHVHEPATEAAPSRWSRARLGMAGWFSAWSPAIATVGVGLALIFAFSTVSTRNELNYERQQDMRVAPQATAGALALSAMVAPRSTTVPLRTPTPGPRTDTMAAATHAPPLGRLMVDPDSGQVVLVVRQLPPLPRQHVYQVWSSTANQRPRPLGLVQVGMDGTGVLVAVVPGGLDRLHDLVITIEPETGSDAPTTPPLVAASF